MKLTNNKIFNLYSSLNTLKSKDLPIKVGFALLQNIKTIEPIYQSVCELRDKLVLDNGTQNEDGTVNVDKDKIGYVNEQLAILGEEESEVELRTIALKDIEDLTMSLNDLAGLEEIISEE